jgi:hypothetical protein
LSINIRFFKLALIFLISISLAAGLDLSVSTGGNNGRSSTAIEYGATVRDYANQHVSLNPYEGSLSNAYSGSGSLPSNSLFISDSKGNYACVSRSVEGDPEITKWNYEWMTSPLYSSSFGSGVGAWLKLTAKDAYSISGSGYSSNKMGCIASASMSVESSHTDSDLIEYSVNPTSFAGEARVYQTAGYTKSTGPISVSDYSSNAEGDQISSSICVTEGSITKPVTTVYSRRTNTCSNSIASSITTTGESRLCTYASNTEGDISRFVLTVNNGKITDPNLYGLCARDSAQTKGSVSSAYGKLAEMGAQGLDNALGYQEDWSWNANTNLWDRTKVKVERGEGDFAALRRNNADFGKVSVGTLSTKNDVVILTSGFGGKTALILDPRRWEFVTSLGASDIRDSVLASLKDRGYAVTYYSDSAVSKDKVKKMDEYWISAIHSYTTPTTMYLSKSSDGANWDTITASELKSGYTYSNGMALIIGSDSFSSIGSGTWADAVSKASVRGGTTSSWKDSYGSDFINKYIFALSYYYPASNANANAAGLKGERLLLLGNSKFIA